MRWKLIRQVALALCMAAVIVIAWLAPLDAPAMDRVDSGLKKALVSFATARLLSGVISVVQGTQFSAQPLGVGVTLTPGQMLAPVNELLKHFANLMLAASVAFGIQKFLISIGSYWLVSLALTATGVAWTWCRLRQNTTPAWLSRLLVIMVMLRFAMPLIAIGSDLVWQRYLAPEYTASQRAIDSATGQASKLNDPAPASAEQPGLIDRMKSWLGKGGEVKARFQELERAAEQATTHIVNLIVIFVLQVLVLPLLLLWGLYGVLRAVFHLPRKLRPS